MKRALPHIVLLSILALLLVGCEYEPPDDVPVKRVIAKSGDDWHGFVLVSDDLCICTVRRVQYEAVNVGDAAACYWRRR